VSLSDAAVQDGALILLLVCRVHVHSALSGERCHGDGALASPPDPPPRGHLDTARAAIGGSVLGGFLDEIDGIPRVLLHVGISVGTRVAAQEFERSDDLIQCVA